MQNPAQITIMDGVVHYSEAAGKAGADTNHKAQVMAEVVAQKGDKYLR